VTDNGYPVMNVKLDVKNTATGVSTPAWTDDDGRFMVDLGNVDTRYRDGDVIKVSLNYCQLLSKCVKSVSVSGGGNEASFDISVESLPTRPEGSVVVKVICWDGTAVEDKMYCPAYDTCPNGVLVKKGTACPQPVVTPTPTPTPTPEPEPVTPEKNDNWIWWAIGVLAALLSGAGGWKFYNGKFQHMHKGIIGYHDPNIKHLNVKYRHTIWKVSALKCISDVKKIQQGITPSILP
jgi:hypothetical protein